MDETPGGIRRTVCCVMNGQNMNISKRETVFTKLTVGRRRSGRQNRAICGEASNHSARKPAFLR